MRLVTEEKCDEEAMEASTRNLADSVVESLGRVYSTEG